MTTSTRRPRPSLAGNPNPAPARLLCPWNSPGKNTVLGCHFLLQGIFSTQGSNPGLLHCRQIFLLSEPPGKWIRRTIFPYHLAPDKGLGMVTGGLSLCVHHVISLGKARRQSSPNLCDNALVHSACNLAETFSSSYFQILLNQELQSPGSHPSALV